MIGGIYYQKGRFRCVSYRTLPGFEKYRYSPSMGTFMRQLSGRRNSNVLFNGLYPQQESIVLMSALIREYIKLDSQERASKQIEIPTTYM